MNTDPKYGMTPKTLRLIANLLGHRYRNVFSAVDGLNAAADRIEALEAEIARLRSGQHCTPPRPASEQWRHLTEWGKD